MYCFIRYPYLPLSLDEYLIGLSFIHTISVFFFWTFNVLVHGNIELQFEDVLHLKSFMLF